MLMVKMPGTGGGLCRFLPKLSNSVQFQGASCGASVIKSGKDSSGGPMQLTSKVRSLRGDVFRKVTPSGRAAAKLPIDVGGNLRRLRKSKAQSLEALAKQSGVSRAMLGQIETGKSVPTVTLLWKIALALGVPMAKLIEGPPSTQTVVVRCPHAGLSRSNDDRSGMRSLVPQGDGLGVECFEISLRPLDREHAAAHAFGARGCLVVMSGVVEFSCGAGDATRLGTGDVVLFAADCEQAYFNCGPDNATGFLIVAPAGIAGL
jgi:transcriptional regulator with XRE-family HTH domain